MNQTTVILMAYFISIVFYAIINCQNFSRLCSIIFDDDIVIDMSQLTEYDKKWYYEIKNSIQELQLSLDILEIDAEKLVVSIMNLVVIIIAFIPIVRSYILIKDMKMIERFENAIST